MSNSRILEFHVLSTEGVTLYSSRGGALLELSPVPWKCPQKKTFLEKGTRGHVKNHIIAVPLSPKLSKILKINFFVWKKLDSENMKNNFLLSGRSGKGNSMFRRQLSLQVEEQLFQFNEWLISITITWIIVYKHVKNVIP